MRRIVEDLEKRGIEKYTIFKLDKPFPFYLLDSNKYNIGLPYYASFFKYITIEFWDPGYNVVFYDTKERYATHKSLGFAKEKSGTLITVDFALEQGKDIYVVPGNIDSPNSVGTNDLIKQGAKLLTKVEDILV